MKIELGVFGKYQTVKIVERFDISTDYEDLKSLIERLVSQGKNRLAVIFTQSDHVSSSIISVLIHFYKKIRDEGEGDLCLVMEDTAIREIFDQLNLTKIIKIYTDIKQIPA